MEERWYMAIESSTGFKALYMREEKQRQKEENKRIKVFERQQRLEKEERKKREKEEAYLAKEAEQQLQNNIKKVKKGRKKRNTALNPQIQEDTSGEAAKVVKEASTVTSRSGRLVRLPHRFRDA
ncbi:hypothetical protein EYZ11_013325 [Aspergillus tanneri]|uniref:Uncharacterized protein n=1 Tax=Aspergillus tanneri TaxID=1220188 RepID=A0A4S3IXY0_9EURO|nr:hypothetical protein EYZ11_013325 [Aspergillus tanneri]